MSYRSTILLILALTAVLLVACGPSVPAISAPGSDQAEQARRDLAQSPADDTPQPAPEAEQNQAEEPPERPVTAAAAEEVGADGIPVGFTDDGRPYRGDLNAPVVMEEFSDYQCPFCSRYTLQTLPALLENQIANGELLLIYHDFPLESIHPQAFGAANAARCAGEQGAESYWEMHDQLYARVQDWSISDPNPVFSAMAGELGLDTAQFDDCQTNLKYATQVQDDLDFGQSRGVNSTPSFFLNDQALIGAQPLDVFNNAIATIQGGESIVQEAPPQESPLQPPATRPKPADIAPDTYAGAMGDPDAPVTIVEFTDYQCPFCQRHSLETLPRLVAEKIETGEIYYVLKDLPLDSIHPNAREAAVAARCAGEQDAYWEMHDALFEGQEGWAQVSAPEEAFVDLATSLGLDSDAFSTCLADEKNATAVQTDVDEATSLGADSTPFFFINGFPVPGAQPYDLFDYAIGLAAQGTLADAYVPPDPSLENVNSIGDPNAPVTIIEYTDYQCPFCSRHFTNTFGQIKEKYIDTGAVYYIFKDFPLTSIHPQAVKAAEAARCAGEQDAYLAMHDQLFADQATWSGRSDADTIFKEYAVTLGLDSASFDECLDSGRTQPAVMAEFQEGSNRGINGTPAFVINGYSMSGAQPYAVFEQAIEQFLSEAG